MPESADAWVCPACGYEPTSEAERQRHKEGVDDKRLECAHQDIEAINARQQSAHHNRFMGRAWG